MNLHPDVIIKGFLVKPKTKKTKRKQNTEKLSFKSASSMQTCYMNIKMKTITISIQFTKQKRTKNCSLDNSKLKLCKANIWSLTRQLDGYFTVTQKYSVFGF